MLARSKGISEDGLRSNKQEEKLKRDYRLSVQD